MDISLQVGGGAPALLGTRNADSPVIRTTATFANYPVVSQHEHHDYQSVVDQAEQKRFENIHQTSAAALRDLYPLGDKTFTIYKDSSGQYITRYVSLRDGTVTYYPEPQWVQYHQPDPKPVVTIKT